MLMMLMMMKMMMMKMRDLVIHTDSDWEVDHIVVRVSEGLHKKVCCKRELDGLLQVRLGNVTSLQQPLYSFTMVPICERMQSFKA